MTGTAFAMSWCAGRFHCPETGMPGENLNSNTETRGNIEAMIDRVEVFAPKRFAVKPV